MNKGRFITLEGGECAGKSTNLPFIRQCLERAGHSVIVTREPGGTSVAEKLRLLLLEKTSEPITVQAELLMIFAARSQHMAQVILPALRQGQWVLCDRFTDATYAYQGGGRAMSKDAIAWLETFVQGDLVPDLTLLLDVPVEVAAARIEQRGNRDRFETEHVQFFERVRETYLALARQHRNRYKIVDAAQAIDSVQRDIEGYLVEFVQ